MSKTIYLFVLAIVIIIGIWIAVKYFGKRNIERFDDDLASEKAQVILFHAKWCNHCVDYLTTTLPNSGKNAFDTASDMAIDNAVFKKVDVDESKALVEQYNISSFPTIIGVSPNGTPKTFDGDRNDSTALATFASSL
jgi:thiol-disulfide isomerase/thioredoxin